MQTRPQKILFNDKLSTHWYCKLVLSQWIMNPDTLFSDQWSKQILQVPELLILSLALLSAFSPHKRLNLQTFSTGCCSEGRSVRMSSDPIFAPRTILRNVTPHCFNRLALPTDAEHNVITKASALDTPLHLVASYSFSYLLIIIMLMLSHFAFWTLVRLRLDWKHFSWANWSQIFCAIWYWISFFNRGPVQAS